MTDEQKKLIEEMRSMGENLKSAGFDFIITLNIHENEQHSMSTRISVHDDHHLLDMIGAIHRSWHKANHKYIEEQK